MGNVIAVPKGANGQAARLNREAFFANGATVDHGDHQHQYVIAGEQVIAKHLQAQDNGETIVTVEEHTLTKEDAFAEYELMIETLFLFDAYDSDDSDDELETDEEMEQHLKMLSLALFLRMMIARAPMQAVPTPEASAADESADNSEEEDKAPSSPTI